MCNLTHAVHLSDMESSLTFEVTPVSLQNITVAFEHPFKESMAIGELSRVNPPSPRV